MFPHASHLCSVFFITFIQGKTGLLRAKFQLFPKIQNEGYAGYQVCVDEELVLFKGSDGHPLEEAVQTAVVDDVVPGDDDDDDDDDDNDDVVPGDDFIWIF